MKMSSGKPYKHIRLVPLSNIKRVIDIKETSGKYLLSEYWIFQNWILKFLCVYASILSLKNSSCQCV